MITARKGAMDLRYLILNKKITSEEIISRKKYIEKVTSMYFIPYPVNGGIEFKSIPSSTDCLFIIGHNRDIEHYLSNNDINEKNIVIVSCIFKIPRKIKRKKKVYISYDNVGKTDYFDGKDWNLNFYVSIEELKLINSNGPFLERVKKYFRRIL